MSATEAVFDSLGAGWRLDAEQAQRAKAAARWRATART